MTADIIDSCWNALCLLTHAVKACEGQIDFCSLRFGADEVAQINAVAAPRPECSTVTFGLSPQTPMLSEVARQDGAYFTLAGLTRLVEIRAAALPQEVRQLIQLYAPYCFAAMHARRWQRAFAVSHFAQSLDGRIATLTGDSKWIGCAENLVHAHRMRALCDGILIGVNTLKRDTPQLTVRLVRGANPRRIVVGSSVAEIDCLMRASSDPVMVIGAHTLPPDGRIRTVTLQHDNGFVSSSLILRTLYQQGISSVYIEGGAITTSRFLREEAIDVVQLHIAPMILGSGVATFSMPHIDQITESIRFASHRFVPVEDHVMFVGEMQRSCP